MKTLALFSFALFFNYISFSQVIYDEIKSETLGTLRKVKIQLPRNYNVNKDKKYPIILVLDGDYLFEPVAGNVDYSSYWQDMPESIVVGVIQGDTRYTDCSYDNINYFPNESGSKFFEFLGLELIPYLDSKFRTAKFIVGVGHDFTANFLNYYLFKSPPLMNGYIILSPDFAPKMENRLVERIPTVEEKIFYYMATGTDDLERIHKNTENLNSRLKNLKSNSFNYNYDNFEGAGHYSLVGVGIPTALNKIFSMFRPISKQEYSNVLLKTETPISQYLFDRYKMIEELFGIKNNIRINDFMATATAAEKRKQWESLLEIAKLANKQYPNTVLGDYFLGRYYEETGNTRKAMRMYQDGFQKEEVDFITVDLMLSKAAKIKSDFGY